MSDFTTECIESRLTEISNAAEALVKTADKAASPERRDESAWIAFAAAASSSSHCESADGAAKFADYMLTKLRNRRKAGLFEGRSA